MQVHGRYVLYHSAHVSTPTHTEVLRHTSRQWDPGGRRRFSFSLAPCRVIRGGGGVEKVKTHSSKRIPRQEQRRGGRPLTVCWSRPRREPPAPPGARWEFNRRPRGQRDGQLQGLSRGPRRCRAAFMCVPLIFSLGDVFESSPWFRRRKRGK